MRFWPRSSGGVLACCCDAPDYEPLPPCDELTETPTLYLTNSAGTFAMTRDPGLFFYVNQSFSVASVAGTSCPPPAMGSITIQWRVFCWGSLNNDYTLTMRYPTITCSVGGVLKNVPRNDLHPIGSFNPHSGLTWDDDTVYDPGNPGVIEFTIPGPTVVSGGITSDVPISGLVSVSF